MGCYHPLKGFPFGSTDQGRTNFIVTSSRVDHIEVDGSGQDTDTEGCPSLERTERQQRW